MMALFSIGLGKSQVVVWKKLARNVLFNAVSARCVFFSFGIFEKNIFRHRSIAFSWRNSLDDTLTEE